MDNSTYSMVRKIANVITSQCENPLEIAHILKLIKQELLVQFPDLDNLKNS